MKNMGTGQYNFRTLNNEKKPTPKSSSSSKFLLVILIIALPLIGFWFGTKQAGAPGPNDNALTETATSTDQSEVATSTEENATADAPAKTTFVTQATIPATPKQTQTTAPAISGPTVLTVYITSVTNENISLDNIAIYEGDAAVKQMAADGLCDAAKPRTCNLEDGYYYRNTDPTIRTYPLSPTVYIATWTGSKYTLPELKSHSPSTTPYSVTIDATGKVIIIKEIYKR